MRVTGVRASATSRDCSATPAIVVPADADAVAGALTRLLSDDQERMRLGDIGRQRIGGPGAIDAILDALITE